MAANSSDKINAYLEIGQKRTFAGAMDWPGWCRSGRDEASALQALVEYGPRYAGILRGTRLGFKAPADASALAVVERLKGDATTDFGAPGKTPKADKRPVDDAELRRLQTMLKACWRAFDAAVAAAAGKELRKGPRGGGREVEDIIRHVLDSDGGYLSILGWKLEKGADDDWMGKARRTREVTLKAVAASAHGEVPARGPRGGLRWTARYFVRRSAWHVIDHTWEIEDRIV